MNIDYLEKATEKILLELGITPDEYTGLIIFLLALFAAYTVGVFSYYKFACRGISCDKIKTAAENSNKVMKIVNELEVVVRDLHIVDKHAHSSLQDSLDKAIDNISSVRDKISELNGIISTRSSIGVSGRKRINHEDFD